METILVAATSHQLYSRQQESEYNPRVYQKFFGTFWLKCNHFLSDINTGTKRYELHKKSLFQTIAGQFEEAGEKGEEKEKDGFTKVG